MAATAGKPLPPSLFLGFAVAAIGGPLALAVIYVPGAADMRARPALSPCSAPRSMPRRSSSGCASAATSSHPQAWRASSKRPPDARSRVVQAAVWAFSYFLYLPYTVTDIVYEMLAVVFPGIEPWRPALELVLPIGIVALLLLGTVPALRVLAVSAVLQLGILVVLGAVVIHHVGAPAASFTHAHGLRPVLRTSPSSSSAAACRSSWAARSLVGSRTIRRALPVAGAVAAAYVLFAVFAFAAVDPALRSADLPGYAIANAYSGRTLAIVVGVGAAVSVAGLIVAEYLALSRLLFAFTGVPVWRIVRLIAVPFVAIDALSLIDPEWFDKNLLRPSLIALYLSQLIVFAVYPLYRRRPVDVALAAIAFGLMAWGLWRGITTPFST